VFVPRGEGLINHLHLGEFQLPASKLPRTEWSLSTRLSPHN